MEATDTTGQPQHDIPSPPLPPAADEPVAAGPYVANPFEYERPPLGPGRLAPGWKSLFLLGWVGVLVGFGCIWQAGRVAGIAPWWLGPETNPRLFLVIALPFIPALITIALAAAGSRFAVHVGVVAGLASMSISLGDLSDHPGLATGEAAIGLAGLLISVACFAGRLRRPDPVPVPKTSCFPDIT